MVVEILVHRAVLAQYLILMAQQFITVLDRGIYNPTIML
jgi:hypothetical protein